jgi:uncharacterized protein YndB with AHSA1/START domain
MSTFELTITKTIPAAPQVVFDAWLSPEALAKFMTPMEGMSVPKAESDAREGGDFLVVMKAGDQEMPHNGTYKTINKYKELAFTWNNPFNDTESLVTLNFSETGSGETELTLHHSGLPSEESRDNHQGGWTHIADSLVGALAA